MVIYFSVFQFWYSIITTFLLGAINLGWFGTEDWLGWLWFVMGSFLVSSAVFLYIVGQPQKKE